MGNGFEYGEERIKKLEVLRELGIEPYPGRVSEVVPIGSVIKDFEVFAKNESRVWVAGRILTFRAHGKSTFSDIVDGTGKIQIYFKFDIIGQEKYELLKLIDIGDFLCVYGVPFVTKTGEKTINVYDYTILAKSLRPLPEKWHGLKDPDLRYRKRYLDLIANPETKKIFTVRADLLRLTREFFYSQGFLEFETPILQPLYGGAFAKPFTTHFYALEKDLYLRIATELYLKRLLVGGFDKVFELGKNFRNEGLDRFHNPEYTSLEAYQSYTDYYGMMTLAENYLSFLAKTIKNSDEFSYQGKKVSVKPPFKRLSFVDSIKMKTGLNILKATETELLNYCEKEGIKVERRNRAKIIEKIFDEKVVPGLEEPTFVLDYPVELSPFAKFKDDNKELVERFELFILGIELANAFTELNDPFEQRARFEEQIRMKTEDFVSEIDEDFIEALEYGMPPAGGIGFGIDRLVMIFADAPSIREVILFPILR